jgi:hypothetical protein
MKIRFKSSEVLILLAASVMSFLANLPDSILGSLVDRKTLLAALTALIIVAMFRYLQMLLLATISILAIGANLPTELASALGISQLALLVSLGVLISISLLNRAVKLLPTDTEDLATEFMNRRQALLAAVAKGDQATLHRLIAMNVSVNFIQDGKTPLHLAAEKGYPEIVRILISHGADFSIKNAEGKTPLEIALANKKFLQTQEALLNVSNTYFPPPGQAEIRRTDSDMWRKQHD